MGAGGGFLQGFVGAAQKKIDQQHQEDQAQKESERQLYQQVLFSTAQPGQPGYYTPEQKQYAQQQLTKASGKKAKPLIEKAGGMFQKLSGMGQQNPSPAAQASLPQPKTAAPGASTDDPGQPSAVLSQPQTPKPQGPQPSPNSGINAQPKTPAPQPAQGIGGFPIQTDADIQARQQRAQQQAQQGETFKTNEQIRAKKEEEDYASQKSRSDRDQLLKDIEGDANLSPEEKKEARLKAYGITVQQPASKTDTHVQLKDGSWIPAQHDPKTGQFLGVDNKPIDPATIQDVRPEPPAPAKDSQEVRDLTEANLASGKFKGPDGKPDKTSARNAALAQRKDQLDAAAKKQAIQITNLQGGGAGNSEPDPAEVDKWKDRARFVATTPGAPTPSFGLGKSKERAAYNQAFNEVLAEMGPDAVSMDRASYLAGRASLVQLQRMKGQIGSFEDTFQNDLQLARDAAAKVPRTQSKKWNSFQQMLESNLTDYPELAQLSVAAQTAVNQYARLVSSATAGGVSTDTARKEAFAILDKAMAKGSFDAALDQMQKEASNRVRGIDTEISKAKDSMSGKSGGLSPNGQKTFAPPGARAPQSADDFYKKYPNLRPQ